MKFSKEKQIFSEFSQLQVSNLQFQILYSYIKQILTPLTNKSIQKFYSLRNLLFLEVILK